jgi:hypothetical protein
LPQAGQVNWTEFSRGATSPPQLLQKAVLDSLMGHRLFRGDEGQKEVQAFLNVVHCLTVPRSTRFFRLARRFNGVPHIGQVFPFASPGKRRWQAGQ